MDLYLRKSETLQEEEQWSWITKLQASGRISALDFK